ncbi:unnamed protein product [Haemonchus placei]|uniref:Recep_L_domain domain-containing protein n=1 Tax=Haemonchus placei TaxID=6290 RepID=A0A0N4X3X1_HAEPC|nr:unnamed protein product [Haemonchus placei]
MYSIGHLFLGGSIRIESSDSFLFGASSVEELLMEGVVGQLDEAFLLDASIQLATIRDSAVQIDSRGAATVESPYLTHSTTTHQSSLHMTNVTMSSLVPQLMVHFGKIVVFNCSIDRIRPSRSFALPRYDTSLAFAQTTIGIVESYAFANMSARNLSITGCTVGKIMRFAAASSRFIHMRIDDTRIESMEEGLFQNSHLKSLTIETSAIAQVLPLTFQRSAISELRIVLTDIGSLDKHALRGARLHTFILDTTNVHNVRGKPFLLAEINALRIVNCRLRGTPARDVFWRLTTTRLSVTNTTFDCDPDDCEVNSMLLKPPRHELLWTFEGNSCRTPPAPATNGKALCTRPSVLHRSGLTCRRSWAIADCVCSGSSSASLPDLNASIVIIGDCEHLTVESLKISSQALYLFRIGRCDFVKIPTMTKALKIYHSNVFIHERAFLNNHISVMALSHTNVRKVTLKAFVNVTIDNLIVGNSSLAAWHPDSVQRSKIGNASIVDCKIGSIPSLLRAVRHLLISNSVLSNTDGLSAIEDVRLSNNTILCCCGSVNTPCTKDKRMRQKCEDHFEYLNCDVGSYANDRELMPFLLLMLLIEYIC